MNCERDIDIYIKNKKNIGITRAFNQAFKLSKGKVILFVDNDTDIKKDWQERTFKILDQKINALGLTELHDYEKFKLTNFESNQLSCPNYRDCFWLIKREVFDKIGLFDENIFCYGEGLDFYLRMCQAGLISAVTSYTHWHLHSLMKYISQEIKNKDISYLKKKWKLNDLLPDGQKLGLQLSKKTHTI